MRAVKKERKLYLWDWSGVPDPGARFENLVACQLLKYCHWIEDTQGRRMELRFLRDTDRREVDFVVSRDRRPLFAVECKTGEREVSASARYFAARSGIPRFYQVHRGDRAFVLVNGPRQSGRTTLVRDQLGARIGGSFATLDDEAQLAACTADPVTYLDRPTPFVIDEFQRAGDSLLRAVKMRVDRRRTLGQYVLTGSTRFLTVSRISESLAGLRDRLDGLSDMRFVRGVVLYTGSEALGFGDRIEALPLPWLWLPPV